MLYRGCRGLRPKEVVSRIFFCFFVLGLLFPIDVLGEALPDFSSRRIFHAFNQAVDLDVADPGNEAFGYEDFGKLSIGQIRDAQHSVTLITPEINLEDVTDAPIQAHKDGKEVLVILNAERLKPSEAITPQTALDLWKKGEEHDISHSRLSQTSQPNVLAKHIAQRAERLGKQVQRIRNSGIRLITTGDSADPGVHAQNYLHAKILLTDPGTSHGTLTILEGSFTTSDFYGDTSSKGPLSFGNHNAMTMIKDAAVTEWAAEQIKYFEQGIFGRRLPEGLQKTFDLDGDEFELMFGPSVDIPGRVAQRIHLIGNRSVRIAAFWLSDPRIKEAIRYQLENSSAKMEFIFDWGSAVHEWSLYQHLCELRNEFGKGRVYVGVFKDSPPDPVGEGFYRDKMHHRFVMIEGEVDNQIVREVIDGTVNFTKAGAERHTELGFRIVSDESYNQYLQRFSALRHAVEFPRSVDETMGALATGNRITNQNLLDQAFRAGTITKKTYDRLWQKRLNIIEPNEFRSLAEKFRLPGDDPPPFNDPENNGGNSSGRSTGIGQLKLPFDSPPEENTPDPPLALSGGAMASGTLIPTRPTSNTMQPAFRLLPPPSISKPALPSPQGGQSSMQMFRPQTPRFHNPPLRPRLEPRTSSLLSLMVLLQVVKRAEDIARFDGVSLITLPLVDRTPYLEAAAEQVLYSPEVCVGLSTALFTKKAVAPLFRPKIPTLGLKSGVATMAGQLVAYVGVVVAVQVYVDATEGVEGADDIRNFLKNPSLLVTVGERLAVHTIRLRFIDSFERALYKGLLTGDTLFYFGFALAGGKIGMALAGPLGAAVGTVAGLVSAYFAPLELKHEITDVLANLEKWDGELQLFWHSLSQKTNQLLQVKDTETDLKKEQDGRNLVIDALLGVYFRNLQLWYLESIAILRRGQAMEEKWTELSHLEMFPEDPTLPHDMRELVARLRYEVAQLRGDLDHRYKKVGRYEDKVRKAKAHLDRVMAEHTESLESLDDSNPDVWAAIHSAEEAELAMYELLNPNALADELNHDANPYLTFTGMVFSVLAPLHKYGYSDQRLLGLLNEARQTTE